ncbi:MAG: cyclic nucleotide-binding domain-containing protein [Treponema sp.]|nr:cyclic nucleotide-binding domain-containing protein [Treponema sp.]
MLQLAFVSFKKGSFLLIEGNPDSDRFYIIQSGTVRCFKTTEIPGISPITLGAGDFIGVVSCLSDHSQVESVVALSDVVAIAVRRDQCSELISRNAPVAMKIIRAFANRMRLMNETLTKLTLKNVVLDTPEHMYDVGAYYDRIGAPNIAVYAYYHYLKACPGGNHFVPAKDRFIKLKPRTHAVYFEPTADLVRYYPKGVMIFSESQSGGEMFIIQSGQVKISKVVDGNEVTLAMLKKGDMFGEMALLENKPRSASAIVHEDCELMVVNRHNFNQMVATQPQLIARLMTTLADRLWSMYRQIDNACLTDPVHKFVDMLALQIEKSKLMLTGKVPLQTDLTLIDLANMCGIPQGMQTEAIYRFQSDSPVKLVNGKVFIPDCLEMVKQAAFYRRQQKS